MRIKRLTAAVCFVYILILDFPAQIVAQPLDLPADTMIATDTVDGLAVGRTAGIGDVTTDGAAQYSIPFWVAPGRAGIQPNLSLNYNSRSGNGLVGVGWTVGGLSQVTRCRKTHLQDATADAVSFDNGNDGDPFCFEGQRLVMVGGLKGPESIEGGELTEYRTENNIHAKITSHAPDALGPRFFQVYLKDGRILTYGGTLDSVLEGARVHVSVQHVNYNPPFNQGNWEFSNNYDQRVRYAWALRRVEDRAGNYMTIAYDTDKLDDAYGIVPKLIRYTGSKGPMVSDPTRSIHFHYEKRPDMMEWYVSGFKMKQDKRLTRIDMRWERETGNSILLRSYNLGYRNDGGTDRSILETVQECDGAAICMPQTSFEWTATGTGFRKIDTTIDIDVNPTQPSTPSRAVLHTGDIDGDGLDDVLIRDGAGVWHHLRSTGTTLEQVGLPTFPVIFPLPGNPDHGSPPGRLVDVNGDGRADFLQLDQIGGTSVPGPPGTSGPPRGMQRVYLSTPDGFQALPDDADRFQDTPKEAYALDINGDGLPELLKSFFKIPTGAPSWGYTQIIDDEPLNSYRELPFTPPVLSWTDPAEQPKLAIDINGSGRTSLLMISAATKKIEALSIEAGSPVLQKTNLVNDTEKFCDHTFLDVNGDNLDDWITKGEDLGYLNVSINTGNGFMAPAKWNIPFPFRDSPSLSRPGPATPTSSCDPSVDTGLRVIDYNRDGRRDLLLTRGYPAPGSGQLEMAVLESNGSGFRPQPLSIPAAPALMTGRAVVVLSRTLDANGDGLEDIVVLFNKRILLYLRDGQASELLKRVTDGLEAREGFEYRPISDTSVHTSGTNCSYPRTCVKRSLWVVSHHRVDRGHAEPGVFAYTYRDGRADAAGRGWLGFVSREATNVETGTITRVVRDTEKRSGTFYPCAGFHQSYTASTPLNPNVKGQPSNKLEGSFNSEILPTVTRLSKDYQTIASCRVVNQYDNKVYFAYQDSIIFSEYETLIAVLPTPRQMVELLRREITHLDRDGYGNTIHQQVSVYSVQNGIPTGRAHGVTNTIQYDNFDSSWIIGQKMRLVITSATRSGRTMTRTIENEFYPNTGLLWKTRIEPDSPLPADEQSDVSLEITYQRNSYGLVTSVTRSGSGEDRTETIAYETRDQIFPETSINAAGHIHYYTFHPGIGAVATERDPNGLITTYRYDGFGRLRYLEQPNGVESEAHFDKDAVGRLRLRTHTAGSAPSEISYDRLGRPAEWRWQSFDGSMSGAEALYDTQGRLASISLSHAISDPPDWRHIEYDNLGRVRSVRHPDGTSVRREYKGLQTIYWDEKGKRRFVVEDEFGRIAKSVQITDNEKEIGTYFEYGPFGVLENITNEAGHRVSYMYDKAGRVKRIETPDTGAMSMHYNAFGEQLSETNAGGITTHYKRDKLGRISTVVNDAGTTSFTWDSAAHGIGLLAQTLSSDAVKSTFNYDNFSRLSQVSRTIDRQTYRVDYTYDKFGRLDTLAYPQIQGRSRLTVRNNYTIGGELKSVQDANSSHVYWQVNERDVDGLPRSESFGNGVVTNKVYSVDGATRYIGTQSSTGTILQFLEYDYEANGNLHLRADAIAHTREVFGYDALDRLVEWEVKQNGRSASTHYEYDDLGNLLLRTEPATASTSYLYGERGAGPHAVTSVKSGSVVSNYDYDAVGRQITGPSRKIEPNNFDLPKDVLFQRVSNAFKYDAFQSRASKKNLPNNRTVYFEDLYEERISGNNVSYIFYIYGSERVISQVNWSKRSSTFQPDSILYLHDDHLGSIETVTDSQGALVDRLKFSPFGARHNGGDLASPTTLPLGNVRRGFAGHEHDESGFINMKGRMYDPQLGRFLSPDPLVGNPSNGQAYNRYSYALNNPLRYTDPTGLQVDQGSWGPPSSPGSEATYNGPTVVVVAPSETPTGAPTIGAPSSSEQVSRWDADDQGAKRVALPTPPDAPQPGKNPPEGSDLGSTRGQGWVEFIQQVISKIDLSRTTEENRAIFREAYEKADKLQDLTLEERQVSADKALENFQDTGRNAGAAIAGGVAKNAGNILPIPNFRRFAPRARLRLGPGAASAEQFVDKVVNSNMGHAAKRAVERAGFRTEKEAREALQKLGAEIQHGGVIPSTAIQDTAHIDRIIVPGFGQGGAVVYQVRNGVLKLKTVLEWRPPVLPPG